MNVQINKPPPPDPMLGFYKAQKSALATGVNISCSVSTNFRSMIFLAHIPEVDWQCPLAEVSMSCDELRELQRDDDDMRAVIETLAFHARCEAKRRTDLIDLFA